MRSLSTKILTAPLGKTHLFFLGQAGFIIKNADGELLGIDLYLSDCVERVEGHMGFKRLQPKLLWADEVELDVIIATHPHLDHFDLDSVPELLSCPKARLYASENCLALTEKLELQQDRISYVRPGDHREQGGFSMHFIACDHGAGAPDAVGAVIETDGKRIVEVGDTCLRLDRVEELLSFGRPDVLIAPINGAYGNLNEQDCVRLTQALHPGAVIPCHFGMFASHGGNPGRFYELMKEADPGQKILFLSLGESVML